MNAHDYYRLRYPYEELVALLTSNGDELHHFEFAIEGTDTYTRFVSVNSAKELKSMVDANLLAKFLQLGEEEQGRLALMVGSTPKRVLAALEALGRGVP